MEDIQYVALKIGWSWEKNKSANIHDKIYIHWYGYIFLYLYGSHYPK